MLCESLTPAIITSFCSRDLMRFASHEEGLHYRRYIVCLLDVTAAMMDGKPAAMSAAKRIHLGIELHFYANAFFCFSKPMAAGHMSAHPLQAIFLHQFHAVLRIRSDSSCSMIVSISGLIQGSSSVQCSTRFRNLLSLICLICSLRRSRTGSCLIHISQRRTPKLYTST